MKKSQARGYLLEIVLSKLIEINGYDVITEEDGNEIVRRGNGLNVRGRGGFHQFDTLGRFKITPPFVYPIRLFVEAKFYDSIKVGIDRVRMGVGILEDVNTNYSTVTMSREELSIEKYQYHYAIFSTSGFTLDAQRFAIAHKIHLIDLTGNEYRNIIDLIKIIVNKIDEMYSGGTDSIPNDLFFKFKSAFSSVIREEGILEDMNTYLVVKDLVLKLKNYVDNHSIYLATSNSPYIIPLLSTKNFSSVLRTNPHQIIYVTQDSYDLNNLSLMIRDNQEIRVHITLPIELLNYLISNLIQTVYNGLAMGDNRFADFLFIAYLDGIRPTLCTLRIKNIEKLIEVSNEIIRYI